MAAIFWSMADVLPTRGEVANKFRKYATGSAGHNVVLVDGKGQADGPKLTEAPLTENLYKISKDFDYGSGIFDQFSGVEGQFSHTRSVVYVRGKFWVVADQLTTDRPRQIETLWHWHPANQVQVGKSGITATANDRGNLAIIPVGCSRLENHPGKRPGNPSNSGLVQQRIQHI